MKIWTAAGPRTVGRNEQWDHQCPGCLDKIARWKAAHKTSHGAPMAVYIPREYQECDQCLLEKVGLLHQITAGCCVHDDRHLYEEDAVLFALRTAREQGSK